MSYIELDCQREAGCLLRILVEAMGHINFGYDQRQDRKGLIMCE